MRPLSYPDSNVFLLTFSITSQYSYDNVVSKWVPEIRHHCPDVPILLVGTKVDLRDDPEALEKLSQKKQKMLQYSDGVNLAKQIGAVAYHETSAKKGIGIEELKQLIISVSLDHGKSSEKEKCLIQ